VSKACAILSCATVLALCGCVGKTAREKAWEDAGRLRLGMTGDEVRATLGDPAVTKEEGAREAWYHAYSSSELIVEEEDAGVASLVVSFDKGRVTGWSVY